jgi:hypothetical protein
MHPSIFILCALAAAGCTSEIANCGDEPDVSGGWHLSLVPSTGDGGTAGDSIPAAVDVEAVLEQAGKTDVLGIGHYVYGTLSAADPGFFGTLTIPRLVHNDGSKTGAVLGCTLRINVPITSFVADDNIDQGALRLALAGQITAPGVMTGIAGSTLVMSSDPTATPRDFSWTGRRR